MTWHGASTVWTKRNGGDRATAEVDPKTTQVLYIGGQNVSIEKSANGGGNFSIFRPNDGTECYQPHFHINPLDTDELLMSCGALWKGQPWETVFTPPEAVFESAIDRTSRLTFAGTTRGELWASPGGSVFARVYEHPRNRRINEIHIDPDNPRKVYLSVESKTDAERVIRLSRVTTNLPAFTSENLTGDLPMGLAVQALATDRMRPGILYAATNQGVWRGREAAGGWSWDLYSEGLPAAAQVNELLVHPRTGVLRASTFGRSAYEVDTDWPVGSTLAAEGKLTLLRVNDVGAGYGPPTDFISAEVIVQLDRHPGKAFGFELRADAEEAARAGMLDLLRTSFEEDRTVRVEYVRTGIHNGRIMRVIQLD